MKQLPINGYIAERVLNRPLLIEPSKARIIANYLETRFFGGFEKEAIIEFDSDDSESSVQIIDGIAIVPIIGTLVHRGDNISAMSGILSYQNLRNMIVDAANNSKVNMILLDIDSGGGEVEGNFDLAHLIRHINDNIKPVVAIANGSAYSGAYSLAVAAGSLFVTPTGGVGSVGVIIQHVDISQNNEMNGIKITNIVAGERKAELSSDFPLSESGKEMLQNEVNRIGNMFVKLVADMRGISENAVKKNKSIFTIW